MYACNRVDLSFFNTAPTTASAEIDVEVSPDKVFDVFEDAYAWTVWAPPITAVHWTSPRPFGIGTTRTVHMMGGMIGEEEFIAWDRGRRMAFFFTACSKNNVQSFAEDYIVEPKGDNRCSVRWSMAIEPRGLGRITAPITGPAVKAGLSFMLGRFKKYAESQAV